MPLSKYEQEREHNIAKNRALLEALDLKNAAASAVPSKPTGKQKAAPVQSSRVKKRSFVDTINAPRRQSSRLRKEMIDPNESPSKRQKREEEAETLRRQQERERLEQEEKVRISRLPRHQSLGLQELCEGEHTSPETDELLSLLSNSTRWSAKGKLQALTDSDFEERATDRALDDLKEGLSSLRVVSRAKVTMDRVYSAVYHSDSTKDLIFFGDKHGQLGIWDAQASADDIQDEDGDIVASDATKEGGKIWRLQLHWPATSKSSISCCRLDPLNQHNIFTTSYDCTMRKLSFETGVSEEIFALEDSMPSSLDFGGSGNELWLSDTSGVVSHLDIRDRKTGVKRYTLSTSKIGCISVNPVFSHSILCASNDRTLKLWDARKMTLIPLETLETFKSPEKGTFKVAEISGDGMTQFLNSTQADGLLRGEWKHDKSVSSAYWSPMGNQIVSTSYDDSIRLWSKKMSELDRDGLVHSMRPFKKIHHNCQTGKWLTILKAQWSPNPNIYPHFTIGDMDHSVNIFSGQGELLARLEDPNMQVITAVQAVTCSSPTVVSRVASGNASGRCVLWAPADEN